jgi:hypothetical protein
MRRLTILTLGVVLLTMAIPRPEGTAKPVTNATPYVMRAVASDGTVTDNYVDATGGVFVVVTDPDGREWQASGSPGNSPADDAAFEGRDSGATYGCDPGTVLGYDLTCWPAKGDVTIPEDSLRWNCHAMGNRNCGK